MLHCVSTPAFTSFASITDVGGVCALILQKSKPWRKVFSAARGIALIDRDPNSSSGLGGIGNGLLNKVYKEPLGNNL